MMKKYTALLSGLIVCFTCMNNFMMTNAEDAEFIWTSYVIGDNNIIYAKSEDYDVDDEVPNAGTVFLTHMDALKENPSAEFAVWINPYHLETVYEKEIEQFKKENTGYHMEKKTRCYLLDLEAERLKENGIQVIRVNKDPGRSNYIYALVNAEDLNAMPFSEEIGFMVGLAERVPFGDINEDESVNILDVIAINRAVLGKDELSDTQANAADINRNGVPDSEDALSVLKYVVGLADLPVV